MFVIDCPWCGPREQAEFTVHGESHVARPTDPEALSDEEWAEYVFYRHNPKGEYAERWVHSGGCGKWFNVLRNTASDEIYTTYPAGTPRPEMPRSRSD